MQRLSKLILLLLFTSCISQSKFPFHREPSFNKAAEEYAQGYATPRIDVGNVMCDMTWKPWSTCKVTGYNGELLWLECTRIGCHEIREPE